MEKEWNRIDEVKKQTRIDKNKIKNMFRFKYLNALNVGSFLVRTSLSLFRVGQLNTDKQISLAGR